MGNALPGAIAIGLGVWLGYKVFQRFWQSGSSQSNPSAPSTPSAPVSALPLNSDYQQPGTTVTLPGSSFFQYPGGPGGASYPSWRGF